MTSANEIASVSPNRNLADQKYWNEAHEDFIFAVERNTPVFQFIERHCDRGPGDILEIGCFPGRFLPAFGGLGFRLNGVDLNRRTARELPEWLRTMGCEVGEFQVADFDRLEAEPKYDIVASFGFVEHFEDWRAVILRQAAFCRPGGQLIVTAPNFDCTVQRVMHRLFDNDSYRCHVLEAMNPGQWARLLKANGFEIEFSGFFGPYGFSLHQERGFMRQTIQLLGLALNKLILRPVLTRLPEGASSYAGFCGVVARKAG